MNVYSVPTIPRGRTVGISFDSNTWDFYVFEDGECVAKLEVGDSQALLAEIKAALASRKP